MKVFSMNISSIKESQKQYYELIKSYEEIVFSDKVSQTQILMIIDEIQCFWFNKKDILLFELQTLTSKKECVLLTSAVYLDVKDNEHYLLKALGNEHIISDPLLKLENFFKVPKRVFDENSIELFQRAFSDVLKVLENYQEHFFILPINLISIENQEKHMKLLQNFFLSFINTMLDENFDTFEHFYEKYSTYTEIEVNMSEFFKSHLTYNNFKDEKLSLKEKVESYINSQPIMSYIFQDKTEAEKFILTLQGLVSQIMEILLLASISNTIPFIRFKPIFHYLITVMQTFIDDEYFKSMIEKTIIFYIFYYSVDKEKLIEINFDKFVSIVQENNFLDLIIQEMRVNNINIFEKGVPEVENIIDKVFCSQVY